MSTSTYVPVIIAASRAIYGRQRAHRTAKKLEGIWSDHDLQGRELVPMDGASITVISARHPLSADSHILDVYGRDFKDGRLREHDGHIVIDRDFPNRATRTLTYRDSCEVTVQRLEIDSDNRTLYIFPTEPAYGKHALRRAGRLGLN